MEQESLLTPSSVQCNGRLQELESISNSPPNSYYSERRATVIATYSELERSAFKSSLNSQNHLSSMQRSSPSLGSKKDFSVELGSQDLCSKNSENRSEHLKFDDDSKHQAKYESTLTNIGVEILKASGNMGVRFKQLQKPFSKSQDSLGKAIKDMPKRRNSTVVHNLCARVPVMDPTGQAARVIENKNVYADSKSSQHHHAGYRLGRRKTLAERRRKIADYSCLLALVGIALMIIEMEFTIVNVLWKMKVGSYVIKSMISLTTVCLLCLISIYHAIEVKLFVVDNCVEDWRISMSWRRIFQIMMELIICAVHPLPGPHYFKWAILDIKTLNWVVASVPTDVLFSLPMFMRLYLIIRVMLLHSKLFTDASSRSIGALNKITFNTRFVLKTLMNIFPGTVLVVFTLSLWIIFAWTLRACECWHNELLKNLLNSLYLVAITFLSVGYGDFIPHTYCGRGVAVLSGLMGAGCTALVVAVIAKKLELTRAEKHVHNFMMENQLSKKLKDAAANVLRETWLIYKYTKMVKPRRLNKTRVRAHQRKFLQAINDLRKVKIKQRKLADQANSLTDFAKTTNSVLEIVSQLKETQCKNEDRLTAIENLAASLQDQMELLPGSIAQAILDIQRNTTLQTAPSISQTDRQD